jgi:hypothetical protein
VVKLALVTKLGRESGSMIKATATLGAALIAVTIAVHNISVWSYKLAGRELTVNVRGLVCGQLASSKLSVGGLGSAITSWKIVDDEAKDIRARCLCKHGRYQWNSGNCVAVEILVSYALSWQT